MQLDTKLSLEKLNISLQLLAPNAPILAKVICRAKTREECIVKMKRALEEFVIEGVKTTIPFHLVLMDNEEFRTGKFDTGLLERFDYVQAIKESIVEI